MAQQTAIVSGLKTDRLHWQSGLLTNKQVLTDDLRCLKLQVLNIFTSSSWFSSYRIYPSFLLRRQFNSSTILDLQHISVWMNESHVEACCSIKWFYNPQGNCFSCYIEGERAVNTENDSIWVSLQTDLASIVSLVHALCQSRDSKKSRIQKILIIITLWAEHITTFSVKKCEIHCNWLLKFIIKCFQIMWGRKQIYKIICLH